MHKRLGKLFLIILFSFLAFLNQTDAQEIQIEGGFIEDSLSIGEEVRFWLRAVYPPQMQLILPDTNTTFTKFEFVDKDYSPTQLIDGLAFDSATYTLQSFEIDPVQYLKLSAIVLSQEDSLTIESNTDSIFFKELAPVVTDTTRLKTNLSYQVVSRQFNFPLLWIVLTGVLVLAVAIFLIFGGRIRKHFRIKRLRSEYEQFSTAITSYIQKLQETPKPETAEEALSLWKHYLEKLEKQPYTKFTTKEILALERNSELKGTLKEIDKTVYGKISQTDLFKKFQDIEDFTQHRYSMALDKLKNG